MAGTIQRIATTNNKTKQPHTLQSNTMVTQRSVSNSTKAARKSCAVLFLSVGIALIAFIGCSSSHSLQLDAPQPVYFGKAPQSALPLDSAHVQFIKQISVMSSHVAEEEKVVQGKSTTFTKEGSEGIRGNVVVQVEDGLENDPDRFIGNAEIRARVEAYVPWTSFFTEFLAVIFTGQAKSEGMGEASSETIEISGTVYKVRRVNR